MTEMTEVELVRDNGADTASALVGGGLMAAGLVGIVAAVRWRRWWALAIPMILMGGGLAVIAGGTLGKRRERIESVEETVRLELDKLDPVARAQVLRDVVAEQMARITMSHPAEA